MLPLGLVAAIVVLAGVVVGLLWFNKRDARAPVVVPAASPATSVEPKASTVVEISVLGAPAGARILVNNSRVNENPFKVKKGEAIVPIRVEADGFEPFSLSVTPSMNRVIQVALKAKKSSKDTTSSAKRTSRKKKKRSSGSVAKESSSPAISIQEKPEAKTVMLPKSAPEADKTEKKPSPEKKKTTVKGARGTKMKTTFE